MSVVKLCPNKNKDIYNPLNKIVNKKEEFKKLIFAICLNFSNFISKYNPWIQKKEFERKNKNLILRFIGLKENTNINSLGKYYQKEFKKYVKIFSKKISKQKEYAELYYNSMFNSPLKIKTKTTNFVIDFFKSMKKNNE